MQLTESFTIKISKPRLCEKYVVSLLISLTKHLKRLSVVQKEKKKKRKED